MILWQQIIVMKFVRIALSENLWKKQAIVLFLLNASHSYEDINCMCIFPLQYAYQHLCLRYNDNTHLSDKNIVSTNIMQLRVSKYEKMSFLRKDNIQAVFRTSYNMYNHWLLIKDSMFVILNYSQCLYSDMEEIT